MLRIYSLTLVCLTVLPVLAQNAAPATADLMKQAQAAYQAKHFSESADLYLRALPIVQVIVLASSTTWLARKLLQETAPLRSIRSIMRSRMATPIARILKPIRTSFRSIPIHGGSRCLSG